ncbi:MULTISPECIES: hypothetical protein [unclassified Pseudomonas]|uniref:hypothetical protein n=1 Tax=unclassified Pseudomonas TaxID=196821 RepID=UPI0015A4D8F8|nr:MULTISPECIES: hypothetical protein [unclassified Pseudomonas]NWC93822.1 hypothetical protein [Pseudomonas sp. IPO3779]NWD16204.1 hypothetical protein [Pseudomonas sp. IPO3778]
MIRSYKEIAETGVGDLYDVQNAFDNVRAIFTLLLDRFPEDSAAYSLAELGTFEINDWTSKLFQWCECMENELDDANAQAQKAAPLTHYLLDQRSHDVAEAISAERKHATRWWSHLHELRRFNQLPEWVAADIGTDEERDHMLESWKAVNQALFGSDYLGNFQPYRGAAL